MRIALVHAYSWPEVERGAERYLGDLAWYLAGVGHQVEVVTGTDGEPGVERGNPATYRRRHLKLPGRPRRQITPAETFGVVALPHLLRNRYDVVHALTPTLAMAARLAGQRTVYTVLIHPTEKQYARRPVERRLTKAAVRAVHAPTAYSVASAELSAVVFGRRVRPYTPGVRSDRFLPALGARTGPPRLLFTADASDQRKSVHVLLAALVRLLDRHPDARLLLAGPGDHEWALKRLGPEREVAEAAVDVLGTAPHDEIAKRYREATVTVLPSHSEAFGIVLIESLASGTPVVCSDSGGMPEIVDDPRVGRVVPWGDAEALATALDEAISLARDPETPGRCAEHARRWDWVDVIGPAHEDLYRSLARSRS